MRESEKQVPTFFTREDVRSVDKEAIEACGMLGIVLMENAARGSADTILQTCNDDELEYIVIVCGSGNNGGDGYAIARHLHNRGYVVRIAAVVEPTSPNAIINLNIAKKMQIPINCCSDGLFENASLVIDAIFGTGLEREVLEPYLPVIQAINECSAKVVAIDIPSGLDCNTGQPHGIAVKANLTITFVGFKQGFVKEAASDYIGNVIVVDIGCPQHLIKKYASPNT